MASWRVVLAIASMGLAAAAHAAPLPRRAGPASTAAVDLPPGPRSRIESVCGTTPGGAAALLEQHWALPENAPLPTPNSTDAGNIAVLEDDGRFFYTNSGNDVIADLTAIGQSFYRTHGDDYDCLAVFLSTGLSTWLGSPTSIAASYVLRSRTSGVGLDLYDIASGFGSPGRLEWMLAMNGLGKYPSDPDADISGDSFSTLDVIAHEFGHRWLAYVRVDSAGMPSTALLGRALQHWSLFFDADSSFMEGCDWATPAPDSFITDGVSSAYGNLDRYLMGLQSAADTDSFFTIHDRTNFNPPGDYTPITWPPLGLSCHARAHYWHVGDVVAQNGPRIPAAATAPHSFRVGFVLVTARGQAATPADLAKLETLRSRFPSYFAAGTRGLGSIDATLNSRAGSVRIAHDPLHDRTNVSAPIPIGARVTIDQAGIPLALDPSSVRVFWRAGTSGPFAPVALAPAAPDSFAAQLPPPGQSETIQYYLYASSDSSGIDAFEPAAGAAAPHSFFVGPDLAAPAIVHLPIPQQGEQRMPVTLLARVTDNAAVSNVRVHWGTDGSISNVTPASVAGRDTFRVSLGTGLTAGHTLDYYFEAFDPSGNSSTDVPIATPHSLHVGHDWVFDSENGDGGLQHALYWYSYRDAWHLSQEDSSPAGGTAWKCGDTAPLPYPVHLDANLYLPTINPLPAGTRLMFEHRYELEEEDSFGAFDGARLEIQLGTGPWMPLPTQGGYDHVLVEDINPFQSGTPCWSGSSGGWRSEVADLSSFAPGPVNIRFRMLADDLVGYDGWTVHHIVVDFPDASSAVPGGGAIADRSPWPNPARDEIRISLASPRAAEAEWALYDLAGRRIATLWRGRIPAGGAELSARLPQGLRAGLYFTRATIEGAPRPAQRLAIVR